VDGNKRVALVACRVFLRLNGYDLFASAEEKYGIFMDIASGKVSEEQLTDWIRDRLVPASRPETRLGWRGESKDSNTW